MTKENKDDDDVHLMCLRHGASRDKSPVSADDISSSSCKFRVYLNSQQHSTISHYLYWVQKFRNEVVAFCAERRKTCHACQYYYKDLTLNERSWTCPGCKKVLDRDENAAINIRHMALLKTIKGLEDGSIVITIHVQNSKNSQAKKGSSASGIGVPKKLSPYPLHKDLTAFIECGGLTSLLALKCVGESHAAATKVVSASSEEAFILPKQSEQTCKERV